MYMNIYMYIYIITYPHMYASIHVFFKLRGGFALGELSPAAASAPKLPHLWFTY